MTPENLLQQLHTHLKTIQTHAQNIKDAWELVTDDEEASQADREKIKKIKLLAAILEENNPIFSVNAAFTLEDARKLAPWLRGQFDDDVWVDAIQEEYYERITFLECAYVVDESDQAYEQCPHCRQPRKEMTFEDDQLNNFLETLKADGVAIAKSFKAIETAGLYTGLAGVLENDGSPEVSDLEASGEAKWSYDKVRQATEAELLRWEQDEHLVDVCLEPKRRKAANLNDDEAINILYYLSTLPPETQKNLGAEVPGKLGVNFKNGIYPTYVKCIAQQIDDEALSAEGLLATVSTLMNHLAVFTVQEDKEKIVALLKQATQKMNYGEHFELLHAGEPTLLEQFQLRLIRLEDCVENKVDLSQIKAQLDVFKSMPEWVKTTLDKYETLIGSPITLASGDIADMIRTLLTKGFKKQAETLVNALIETLIAYEDACDLQVATNGGYPRDTGVVVTFFNQANLPLVAFPKLAEARKRVLLTVLLERQNLSSGSIWPQLLRNTFGTLEAACQQAMRLLFERFDIDASLQLKVFNAMIKLKETDTYEDPTIDPGLKAEQAKLDILYDAIRVMRCELAIKNQYTDAVEHKIEVELNSSLIEAFNKISAVITDDLLKDPSKTAQFDEMERRLTDFLALQMRRFAFISEEGKHGEGINLDLSGYIQVVEQAKRVMLDTLTASLTNMIIAAKANAPLFDSQKVFNYLNNLAYYRSQFESRLTNSLRLIQNLGENFTIEQDVVKAATDALLDRYKQHINDAIGVVLQALPAEIRYETIWKEYALLLAHWIKAALEQRHIETSEAAFRDNILPIVDRLFLNQKLEACPSSLGAWTTVNTLERCAKGIILYNRLLEMVAHALEAVGETYPDHKPVVEVVKNQVTHLKHLHRNTALLELFVRVLQRDKEWKTQPYSQAAVNAKVIFSELVRVAGSDTENAFLIDNEENIRKFIDAAGVYLAESLWLTTTSDDYLQFLQLDEQHNGMLHKLLAKIVQVTTDRTETWRDKKINVCRLMHALVALAQLGEVPFSGEDSLANAQKLYELIAYLQGYKMMVPPLFIAALIDFTNTIKLECLDPNTRSQTISILNSIKHLKFAQKGNPQLYTAADTKLEQMSKTLADEIDQATTELNLKDDIKAPEEMRAALLKFLGIKAASVTTVTIELIIERLRPLHALKKDLASTTSNNHGALILHEDIVLPLLELNLDLLLSYLMKAEPTILLARCMGKLEEARRELCHLNEVTDDDIEAMTAFTVTFNALVQQPFVEYVRKVFADKLAENSVDLKSPQGRTLALQVHAWAGMVCYWPLDDSANEAGSAYYKMQGTLAKVIGKLLETPGAIQAINPSPAVLLAPPPMNEAREVVKDPIDLQEVRAEISEHILESHASPERREAVFALLMAVREVVLHLTQLRENRLPWIEQLCAFAPVSEEKSPINPDMLDYLQQMHSLLTGQMYQFKPAPAANEKSAEPLATRILDVYAAVRTALQTLLAPAGVDIETLPLIDTIETYNFQVIVDSQSEKDKELFEGAHESVQKACDAVSQANNLLKVSVTAKNVQHLVGVFKDIGPLLLEGCDVNIYLKLVSGLKQAQTTLANAPLDTDDYKALNQQLSDTLAACLGEQKIDVSCALVNHNELIQFYHEVEQKIGSEVAEKLVTQYLTQLATRFLACVNKQDLNALAPIWQDMAKCLRVQPHMVVGRRVPDCILGAHMHFVDVFTGLFDKLLDPTQNRLRDFIVKYPKSYLFDLPLVRQGRGILPCVTALMQEMVTTRGEVLAEQFIFLRSLLITAHESNYMIQYADNAPVSSQMFFYGLFKPQAQDNPWVTLLTLKNSEPLWGLMVPNNQNNAYAFYIAKCFELDLANGIQTRTAFSYTSVMMKSMKGHLDRLTQHERTGIATALLNSLLSITPEMMPPAWDPYIHFITLYKPVLKYLVGVIDNAGTVQRIVFELTHDKTRYPQLAALLYATPFNQFENNEALKKVLLVESTRQFRGIKKPLREIITSTGGQTGLLKQVDTKVKAGEIAPHSYLHYKAFAVANSLGFHRDRKALAYMFNHHQKQGKQDKDNTHTHQKMEAYTKEKFYPDMYTYRVRDEKGKMKKHKHPYPRPKSKLGGVEREKNDLRKDFAALRLK